MIRIKYCLFISLLWVLIPFEGYTFDQQLDMRVSGGTSNSSEDYGKSWSLLGNIYARYTLKNENNTQIRGVFSLDANVGTESAFLGVYQAYIRVRFNDYFRMTFGKAPLTWGEGMYYNAGDVFFDSSNTGIVLSNIEIRDNSQWMTDMYFSLGQYSYFQIVAVFPTMNYYTSMFYNAANQIPGIHLPPMAMASPTFKDSSAGWRLGGKLGSAQMQIGGAYKGDKQWYTSYASLTAGIADIMDMYLDTRISVGRGLMQTGDYKKTLEVTMGLYYTTNVDAGMVTVRLETIFRPYQNWRSLKTSNTIGGDIVSGGTNQIGAYNYYGNEIYFEVGGNVTSFLNLYLRNVFSTIDVSDYMSLMIDYLPIDKLTISVNLGVQLGEKSDLFSFRKAGATSIYFMARYIYE